jgi:HSP20 family protein
MSLFTTLIPSLNRTLANGENATDAAPASTVKPVYNVNETPEGFSLTVELPGVAKDGVELASENGQFRLVAQRAWRQPQAWTALYRESADAPYELVLTHDDAINAEKIEASFSDGVLQVTLPKTESVKPRKIAVN